MSIKDPAAFEQFFDTPAVAPKEDLNQYFDEPVAATPSRADDSFISKLGQSFASVPSAMEAGFRGSAQLLDDQANRNAVLSPTAPMEGRALNETMRDSSVEKTDAALADMQATGPDTTGMGWLAEGAVNAPQSVGLSIATLPIAMATKNLAAPLAAFGLTTGGQAYAETEHPKAGEAKMGRDERALHAVEQGAIEAGTELIPAGKLVKDVGKEAIGTILKHFLVREVGSEELATVSQNFSDWAHKNPDKTLKEFLAEQPHAMVSTLGGVAMGAGMQSGSIYTASKGLDYVAKRASEEVLKHEADKADMQATVDKSESIAQLPPEVQEAFKANDEDMANAAAMAGVDEMLASLEVSPLTEQDRADAIAEADAEKAAKEAEAEGLVHPDIKDTSSTEQADEALSLYRQGTRDGEENTNDTSVVPLMKQRVTVTDNPEQAGKTLGRAKLVPGTAVGVSADTGSSDLFPADYRKAAVDTATWMMQKLGLANTKLVLKFEALTDGTVASVDVHKNGTYVINPSHMTRFNDPAQYSQIAQVQAASSLAHEIGHIFTLESIQGGMTKQHRAEFDSLPDNALLSEGLIAAQSPEIQSVLLEYNAMKARVLDGSMSAQEFIDTWLGPSKSGRGLNTKDGRQTFGQDVAGAFRNVSKMNAKDFAAALTGSNILSAHEYLAEQMARYAHDRKLLENTPLGTKQFFERALAALRDFFVALKKEGIIKAGTSFTSYVDSFTNMGASKAKVKRPRKAKAAAVPVTAIVDTSLVKRLTTAKNARADNALANLGIDETTMTEGRRIIHNSDVNAYGREQLGELWKAQTIKGFNGSSYAKAHNISIAPHGIKGSDKWVVKIDGESVLVAEAPGIVYKTMELMLVAAKGTATKVKEKKAKAPVVVQQLPEAFRFTPLLTKPKSVAAVAEALMGVDKLDVKSAKATAAKILKTNPLFQKVKAEEPAAYKEMQEYIASGQLEQFREMAEDYIGYAAAQKMSFHDTSPIAGDATKSVDWTWSAVSFLEEKAPKQNTLSEWVKLLTAWKKNKSIKASDLSISGVLDSLANRMTEEGNQYYTKEQIIEMFQNAAGPFDLEVLAGENALHPFARPDEFLADGEYTNLANYHELVLTTNKALPATAAARNRFPSVKGQPVIWIRGEFVQDAKGRTEFHVHELQADASQALAAYKGRTAVSAEKAGNTRTVFDEADNALATYPAGSNETANAGIQRIDAHNQELAKLQKYEKAGVASSKTDVWLGQALRTVMRYAADNGAATITFATAAQQLSTYPSDTISWGANLLSIKTGSGEVLDAQLTDAAAVSSLLLDAGYSPADVAKHTATIMASPVGQLTPRKGGMNNFYGVGGETSPAIIWSTLRKQKLWAEQPLEFTDDNQGIYVSPDWRAKPVTFFDTDPSKGTGPEFEAMTRELHRTGLAGEMQNAGRKLAAFGSRMANSVVTIQQLAFANKYIAGLTYYKDQTIAFQAYKASLEISAVSVAHEWSKLGKEQYAKLNKFLEAEYEEGTHYATLQKNPATKKWELVVSPRFAEEARKHGLSETTAALALRIKQSILSRQNSLENTLFTQALLRFGPQSKRAKVAIAEIMQTMEAIRSQPHLPQSRFGDYGAMVYEVTFDSAGKEVKVLKHKEFFQTEGHRDEAVRQLQKAVGEGHLVTAYNYRTGMSRFGGVPAGVLSTISQELELSEEQQNQVMSMLDTAGESRALRQYSKKLANVTGRNKDLLRNYADYMQADANIQAKMRYGSEFKRALTSVANDIALLDAAPVKDSEYAAERRKLESVLQYMESHKDYMMNPKNEFGAIKTVVVMWQLWGVVKSALANATALVAVLADAQAHFGNIKGTVAVGKASLDTAAVAMNRVTKTAKQLLKIVGSDSKVLSPDEDWAITRAQVEGVLDQTFAAQLGDFSEAGVLQRLGGSQVNNMWQHTKRMGLIPLHMVEVSTRYIALLTKFRLYQTAGLPRDEAYKHAAEETRLIMGDSTRINRPPFMRGKAANFTIYYGFTQLMMYMFSGAYERGYSERAIELNSKGYQITPRKNAIGGMTTRMWLMFLLLGGAEGLPGEADIRAIVRFIAQKVFGVDYDLDLEARKWVMDFNKHIDDLGIQLDPSTIMHGISHNTLGFDLSGSIGFGRIIPGLSTLGDSGSSGTDVALAGAGPLGGFVSGMIKAVAMHQPTVSMQIAPAMPTVVKNQLELYNWVQDGVRFHSGGNVLRDLDSGEIRNLHTNELIGKSLGFNPTIVAQNREMHFMQKDAAMFWAEKHSAIMGAVAEAVLHEDREAIADSVKALGKFNKNCPRGMQINQRALLASVKMSSKRAAYDTAGVPMQKAQQGIAAEVKSTFPTSN